MSGSCRTAPNDLGANRKIETNHSVFVEAQIVQTQHFGESDTEAGKEKRARPLGVVTRGLVLQAGANLYRLRFEFGIGPASNRSNQCVQYTVVLGGRSVRDEQCFALLVDRLLNGTCQRVQASRKHDDLLHINRWFHRVGYVEIGLQSG